MKVIAVILLILATALPERVAACPGCAAAMDSTLGKGFNMSILFMMAMPFLVFGSIALGIIYIRHNHKNNPDQPEEEQN